jgi:hypothetical protein
MPMWVTSMERSTRIAALNKSPWALALPFCVGCITGGGDRPERAGAWYATDLHIHTALGSNDSDQESTVAAYAELAQTRGLDLIIFTDHSNSAGSMDCASGDVEDCPNQGPEFPAQAAVDAVGESGPHMAVGVEISPVASLETTTEPTGHIGCIPRPGLALTAETGFIEDRPAGSVTGGAGLAWCEAAGGFSVLNHPHALAPWIAYDWSSMDYNSIEVFNGGARFDVGDAAAVNTWMCDLAQGQAVVAVGGSDSHRVATNTPPESALDQALGFPTTWVWSTDASRDGLLAALQAGRTVVSDPRTSLDVVAWSDSAVAGPGETITGPVTLAVDVSVTEPGLQVEVLTLSSDSCVVDTRAEDGAVPEVDPTVLFVQSIVPGVATHHELELDEAQALLVRVWPTDDRLGFADGVSLASPIVILPAN